MTVLIAQYFLNHRLDSEEIKWQVEEIAKAGYQGILAHARQGLLTPYMSESWWEAIDKILEVCHRTGLEFWIWDEDYFPSGLAGGRVAWENPGLIARGLEFTIERLAGEGPFELDFAPGMLLKAFAVAQRTDGTFDEPQDVTRFCGTRRQAWTPRQQLHQAYSPLIDFVGHPHWRCDMEDNRFALQWTPPHSGKYVLIGVVIRTSTNNRPDMLRPEGVKRFIELSYEPYAKRYDSELGRLITGAFTDEPDPGPFLYPWTPRFPEEFLAEHDYDLLDELPHLALDLDERSAAVRHHYRLTQHRLQRKHYVSQIALWCEMHGVQASGHLHRTEWLSLASVEWPNQIRCYKPMHIPAVDPLGASCAWSDAAAYHSGIKVVSSAAHLFGQTHASSDALAVVGDEVSLRDLKYILDYQMVLGINHFCIHGLSYSIDGPRKDEAPPSLFYQHTEWKHMRVLLDYLRQTCEVLSEGVHQCHLMVLYPSTSLACQAIPEVDWLRLPDEAQIHEIVEKLLSHQRDFDFIDEVTLQENVSKSGKITTPEAYQAIILPYLRYIDQKTSKVLLEFAYAGGRVIAVGVNPVALTHDLSHPLLEWTDDSVEFWETLDEEKMYSLPGIDVQGEGARDVFILRRLVGQEIRTFLFNRREQPFKGEVDGLIVRIPQRGSVLLNRPFGETKDPHNFSMNALSKKLKTLNETAFEFVADISTGWIVFFEDNQLPLNYWHVQPSEGRPFSNSPFSNQGFDLMTRQLDPAGKDSNRVSYFCRFMLVGKIPNARLVMEDSTVIGEWTLSVNRIPIESWQRAIVFDCRNIVAPVGHLLRGCSTPCLNVLRIDTEGPRRGLEEVVYLYGSFTCEYRYGHLSFPFVQGTSGAMDLDTLQTWDVIGYPTFSGSAIYRKTVDIPESGHYVIELGRVEDVASVSIDGRNLAVLPWYPYRCDWPDSSPGAHELMIELTNVPANRQRASRLPAGLLGPVKLLKRK